MYLKDDFRKIVSDADFLTASLFRVITQMGVPCFVMLSGAFLLKNGRNADYGSFYRKSARKLGIPILVFSILYVLMHYIENILGSGLKDNSSWNVWQPVTDWIKGVPNVTMWYMYMIIPLYLATPFIVRIKSSVTPKEWYVMSVIMMLYSMLVAYTCTLSWLLQFMQWIGYFLMGDMISSAASDRIDLKISRYPRVCIGASYTLLLVYWYVAVYRTMRLTIPNSLSPVCVVAAVLLFTGFAHSRVKANRCISTVSKYSFYIYLIHPFICEVLMQLFGRILRWFPTAGLIPLYAVFVTGGCTVLAYAGKRLKRDRSYRS